MKGVAQVPNILEDDIDTMLSTNVTGLINMTQVRDRMVHRSRSCPYLTLQVNQSERGGEGY